MCGPSSTPPPGQGSAGGWLPPATGMQPSFTPRCSVASGTSALSLPILPVKMGRLPSSLDAAFKWEQTGRMSEWASIWCHGLHGIGLLARGSGGEE